MKIEKCGWIKGTFSLKPVLLGFGDDWDESITHLAPWVYKHIWVGWLWFCYDFRLWKEL